MPVWASAAAMYGLVMAVAALTHRIPRRPAVVAAASAYVLLALAAASLATSFWIHLLAPGALLLAGYWLSGMLFRSPQPWLEAWLLRTDRALGAHRWMSHAPRPVREFLEACYAAVSFVVGGGAIFAAATGDTEAVASYWSLVLTSALASYAPLPWLRSRPPRSVEDGAAQAPDPRLSRRPAGQWPRPAGRWPRPAGLKPRLSGARRLNLAILDSASIQANTLPSGHVSAALAAALGVLPLAPSLGVAMIVAAGLIAVAAVAGRYHYAVDCVAGAGVALAVWWLV